MGDDIRACVRTTDAGVHELVDPDGAALGSAVACDNLYASQRDRLAHFAERHVALGRALGSVAIMLIDVDDKYGAMLADVLMPGFDWQAIRDRGERPVARGLAPLAGLRTPIELLSRGAGEAIDAVLARGQVPVIVVAGQRAAVRGQPLPRSR